MTDGARSPTQAAEMVFSRIEGVSRVDQIDDNETRLTLSVA